jgi:hypothetical protein
LFFEPHIPSYLQFLQILHLPGTMLTTLLYQLPLIYFTSSSIRVDCQKTSLVILGEHNYDSSHSKMHKSPQSPQTNFLVQWTDFDQI